MTRKLELDAQEAKAKADVEAQEKAWQDRLKNYETSKEKAKEELKIDDFDDAEAEAMEIFSTTQQGIIIHGSKKPEVQKQWCKK